MSRWKLSAKKPYKWLSCRCRRELYLILLNYVCYKWKNVQSLVGGQTSLWMKPLNKFLASVSVWQNIVHCSRYKFVRPWNHAWGWNVQDVSFYKGLFLFCKCNSPLLYWLSAQSKNLVLHSHICTWCFLVCIFHLMQMYVSLIRTCDISSYRSMYNLLFLIIMFFSKATHGDNGVWLLPRVLTH